MKQAFDFLFVGAGPASLSGALHLKRLLNKDPELKKLTVAIIEKSPNVGDHLLSGASFDPKALKELVPDYTAALSKIGPKVTEESISYLTGKSRIPFPIVPPQMSNHGCYLLSIAELSRWLCKLCENEGVEVYTGEPADNLLLKGKKVIGVIVKDKGINKEGEKKPNYLAPTEVEAKVTILGEGARGHLTKRLMKHLGLDENRTSQGHAVGIKEIWEVKEENFFAGKVMHTMGYPLSFQEFGGSFAYHIKDRLVALGLVIGLDYKDADTHPHELLQRWKMHPHIKKTLEGGKLVSYGAKVLAEGGWYSVPKLSGDGFLIIGENAGLLNSMKLKGVHLAMKSGMLAAETIFEALKKNDYSAASLGAYDKKIDSSWIKKELWRSRNFHQAFHKNFFIGLIHSGLQMISGGRGIIDKFKVEEDYKAMKMISGSRKKKTGFIPDGKISFDKLTSVFASGTKHDEDQPCHLKIDDMTICNEKCGKEYGHPCTLFCPANVYEIVEDEDGRKKLEFNPTNCLHCKTCDIKDPYGIITWVPPEGGGGPNYKGM